MSNVDNGDQKHVVVTDADASNHPFVKFSYGADVHLPHKSSGLTLHLHSTFFGVDLSEEKLVSTLGDCYLGVEALIHFFETIQFMPGYGIKLDNEALQQIGCFKVTPDFMDSLNAKSKIWFDALCVADLLGLSPMVASLAGMGGDKFILLDTLLWFLENRHRHSPSLLNTVLDSTWVYRSEIVDAVNALSPLVDDPLYGRAFYGQAVAKVAMRTGRLEGGEWTSRVLSGESRLINHNTLPWSSQYAKTFADCLSRKALPSIVEVDAAYILPAESCVEGWECPIRIDSEIVYGCTMVTLRSEIKDSPKSLRVLFGNLRKGSTVVLPMRADAQSEYVIAVVSKFTDVSMVLQTYGSERAIAFTELMYSDFAENFLSIRTGPSAGKRFTIGAKKRLGPSPSFAAMFSLSVLTREDVLLSSANFVICCANECEPFGQTDVCKGFLVHDWVMYQKWPFFRRMIDAGMEECKSRRLVLPSHFPPSLLRTLVSYAYTGVRQVFSPEQTGFSAFLDSEGAFYGLDDEEFSLFGDPRFRWSSKALNVQLDGMESGIVSIGGAQGGKNVNGWSPPRPRNSCDSCVRRR